MFSFSSLLASTGLGSSSGLLSLGSEELLVLTLRPRFLTLIFFQVVYSILKAHRRLNAAEREIHGVHEHTLNLFRDLLVLELELIEFAAD